MDYVSLLHSYLTGGSSGALAPFPSDNLARSVPSRRSCPLPIAVMGLGDTKAQYGGKCSREGRISCRKLNEVINSFSSPFSDSMGPLWEFASKELIPHTLPQVRAFADANSRACVQEHHAQKALDPDRAMVFAPEQLLRWCCYFLSIILLFFLKSPEQSSKFSLRHSQNTSP